MDFTGSSSGKEPRHGNTKSGTKESIGFLDMGGWGGAQLREAHQTSADRISDFSSSFYHFFLRIRGEIRLQERWSLDGHELYGMQEGAWKAHKCHSSRYFRKPTSCFCKYPDDITDSAHVTNNPTDPYVLCKIS